MNTKVKASLETIEGKLMFCLVREFLEFFNLDCTLSVYEPESYLGKIYEYQGRETLAEELGLEEKIDGDAHVPLLLMLIRLVQLRKNHSISKEYIPVTPEIKQCESMHRNLNTTFDLSKPTITLGTTVMEPIQNSLNSASRISEDSYVKEDACEKVEDIEINSQPVLKDSRNGDKIKPKNHFSEMPTLQNNKTRVSDILPSLYNKDYKDKSDELDKVFDIEAEYEEDFMYSSDLSIKCDSSKIMPEERNINFDSGGAITNEPSSSSTYETDIFKKKSNSLKK